MNTNKDTGTQAPEKRPLSSEEMEKVHGGYSDLGNGGSGEGPEIVIPQRERTCAVCGKVFDTVGQLLYHKITHSGS